ncbi:MAG: class I SAM-dependent methyltransferase [Sediminibacterium sp.]|nr:class I SAM-dependent methyltransferase [Sediminibacterium sp.]
MKKNSYSETAEAAAFLRALHFQHETSHIVKDSYAKDFTSNFWRFVLANQWLMWLLKKLILKDVFKTTYGQNLSRLAFAEDSLEKAINQNVQQLIILGAGLDSFIFRRPDLVEKLIVFEIDHPKTQELKLMKIKKLGLTVSHNVHFLAIDFEKENLTSLLNNSIFDKHKKTFITWLGVSYYLNSETIFNLFKELFFFLSADSLVCFDICLNEAELDHNAQNDLLALKKFVARKNEDFKSNFKSNQINSYFNKLGFEIEKLLLPNDVSKTYFSHCNKDLSAAQWSAYVLLKRLSN